MSLLRSELQGIIGSAVNFLMLDMVISHKGEDSYDANDNLVQTPTPHDVRGFEDAYSDLDRAAGIPSTYRKFVVLADGLSFRPQPEDTLTFEGRAFTIRSVGTDPSNAAYTLDCE